MRYAARPVWAIALLFVFFAIGGSGCATYADRISGAHVAAAGGDYLSGIDQLNSALEVESSDDLPGRFSGDKALATLERGSLQQAAGRYEGAARDLSAADQELELLELDGNGLDAIASYLYSDSAKNYKTPPTERLALNAINLQNYLAIGDLSGAAVEARRFQVMREYLDTVGGRPVGPDTLGAYLSGFVFEKAGEGDRALRYYDEALAGRSLRTLIAPVRRLASRYPYRGRNLDAFLAGAHEIGAHEGDAASTHGAELLVVVNTGRVPHRVAERILAGAAVGIAGIYLGDHDADVLKYSATKVLVYPELRSTPSSLRHTTVSVDGRSVDLERLADLGGAIRDEYADAKPKILAAALSRMVARAAVAEGVRAAGNEESALLGDILAILFESALVALDRPDTRSWTMLPDRVLVARVPVTAGEHLIEVDFGGAGAPRSQTHRVDPGGWAAVVITEPR